MNNVRGSVGSGNAAYRGILHFLVETQGSDSGLTNYERRVVGQVTVATSVLEYVNNNAAEVKRIIREQKAAIVEAGKTYDVTLRTSYSSNYGIPTYNTIDATGIDMATDTLTTNNDPIYALSKNNFWAANGYLNASISVIYDPYKTFYMNTFYDYENDIDVEEVFPFASDDGERLNLRQVDAVE